MNYYCAWYGKDVQPTPQTCFWLFGPRAACDAYVELAQGNGDGPRCAYLVQVYGLKVQEDD